ncbi:hypothetical protein R5R35_009922 [Gryllus longicercus]|uniref:Ig-like domain-containing protein n=1 Tax=Gryllus longicercus TaxID=2509291 RepID=A0AAN9V8L0_9ORTH
MSYCHMWLLTLLSLQWFLTVHACPSSCKCMWKGGKQTVECINEKLITIPDGINPGTQVLDFSENNLQVLPRERFQRMGLVNLQRIYLIRCRISQIDERAFKGLTNLVELDLSHNLLNSVPTETFVDYPSLMRLTFNGNPIQKIKAMAFTHLTYLTTLELSNCQIEVIEPEGFAGLGNLEWLKLDGNRLSNVQGSKTLPESLHGILLHRNPWQCDCRLMDLYFWLHTYNVPHPLEPKCVAPQRLQGETIRSLELADLACLPDVSPTTLYLEIAEGKNVSLLCRVSAIPEARVSWWFQGRILQNDSMVAPGIHLYYFVEEGNEEKRSELFIFNTNTDDNGTFVCVAENPAGKAHSNYTIRIVVKEEPVVGVATFPYEYVVTVSTVCSVLVMFLVTCGIVCAVRCQRSRQRRHKKERSKAVALQHHLLTVGGKAPDDACKQITRLTGGDKAPASGKANGDVSERERRAGDAAGAAPGGGAGCGGDPEAARPAGGGGAGASPQSLRNYALEQNPDLINDTESVGKERRAVGKRGDGDGGVSAPDDPEHDHSANNSYQEAMENIIHDFDPHENESFLLHSHGPQPWRDDAQYPLHVTTLPRGQGAARAMYQHHHTADVHLSPGRFLDSDGYPIDYGLPKLPLHSAVMGDAPTPAAAAAAAGFYRTLPRSRPSRLETVGSARCARPPDPQAYERYSPAHVRYTAEGYPCPQTKATYPATEQHVSFSDDTYLPSPPAPYKGEPTIPPIPVCGAEDAVAVGTLIVGENPSLQADPGLWAANTHAFHIQNIHFSETINTASIYCGPPEKITQCCAGSQTCEESGEVTRGILKKPVQDAERVVALSLPVDDNCDDAANDAKI